MAEQVKRGMSELCQHIFTMQDKIYISKCKLQSEFRNSVYLTSLSLGQFSFFTLTQYITGLSLFHTLINRNPFHCIQQICILSYNYICKLPIFYTNLTFFISASLILRRSEPETKKMHIFSFPDRNKQYHRQYTAFIMSRIISAVNYREHVNLK